MLCTGVASLSQGHHASTLTQELRCAGSSHLVGPSNSTGTLHRQQQRSPLWPHASARRFDLPLQQHHHTCTRAQPSWRDVCARSGQVHGPCRLPSWCTETNTTSWLTLITPVAEFFFQQILATPLRRAQIQQPPAFAFSLDHRPDHAQPCSANQRHVPDRPGVRPYRIRPPPCQTHRPLLFLQR